MQAPQSTPARRRARRDRQAGRGRSPNRDLAECPAVR